MPLLRRSLTVALVTFVCLAGLGLSNVAANESDGSKGGVEQPRPVAVARGLIVKTVTGKPSSSVLKAANAAIHSKATATHSDVLTGTISTIEFDKHVPASVAAKVAVDLAKRSDVVWAAPNTLRHATNYPSPYVMSDPYFETQRNLWDSTYAGGGFSIKAPLLWPSAWSQGQASTVVAVIDTGILTDQPDLQDQLVAGYDMIDADRGSAPATYVVAGDGNGRDADPSDPGDWTTAGQCGTDSEGTPTAATDSSWHGTFVAGIVAAKSSNSVGITGIASGVRVQPVRVLGRCGGWDSDIIAGITWASGGHVGGVPDNATPAKVVNLSLGFTYWDDEQAERDLACQAYASASAAGRSRGSVFIAAAGNDAGDANLAVPASCPGFISVGATSTRGFGSWYSNIGSSVDISAPGGDTLVEGATDSIVSLGNSGTKGPLSSKIVRMQGTSMAAPAVSAAAALLYSLGVTSASKLENAVLATVQPFHTYSSTYAKKPITLDGHTYYWDLNCVGHSWCGTGILDLSKIPAPVDVDGARVSGTPAVGEPLTAVTGSWVGSPTFKYQWLRDGQDVFGANSATYIPTASDVGSKFAVRITPSVLAYSQLAKVTQETDVVPDGPEVTMTPLTPSTLRYGATATTTVTLEEGTQDGVVELRRGNAVLASGTTVDGAVTLTVPGTGWVIGDNAIRAAYLGAGTTSLASSVPSIAVVSKALSSITWSLPTTVKKASRAKLYVKVRATGVPTTQMTGTIKVYKGSTRIYTFSLSTSHKGVRTVYLPTFSSRGTYKIKVVYSGNTYVNGKTSSTRTIKVY